jgi:methionyl-tRNA formyltransferase
MKMILLTTESIHHRYFAAQVHRHFLFQSIFVETRRVTPPFETYHPIDDLQDQYERETLLPSCQRSYTDIAETYFFPDLDEDACIKKAQQMKPDLILIIGTRKVSDEIINAPSVACLNLHGANPEEYKGFESYLWRSIITISLTLS